MDNRILWLMGLCLFFFAFGLWCGWVVWRQPHLNYKITSKPGDWIEP